MSLELMHSLEIRTSAISLARSGVPNTDIARRLNVRPGTIGYWKFLDREQHPEAYAPTKPSVPYCPSCHGAQLDIVAYSYLLGLYLGDGHIIQARQHRVSTLSIYCCDGWPGLMDAAAVAMERVIPSCSVVKVQRQGCTEVKVYSLHWPCLFPQHGPGMKHTRKIELADWQRDVVEHYPREFIRGLIHSDGCRVTNWTEKIIAGEVKRYEYPRYFFTNASTDIRELYCWALDMVGVEWRRTTERNISVAKRASVALMDTFVGPKY
jgi:hypothetical protein